MFDKTLRIDAKFRGPPNSGNGGYVAGIFASEFSGEGFKAPSTDAVEVTLRAPTPLDRSLSVHPEAGGIRIRDGSVLIAEAVVKPFELDVPDPATWSEANAVREQSYSFPIGLNTLFATPRRGVHPICFCCGAELSPTEGAHVYSAPVPSKNQVAAAWCPPDWMGENGWVRPEFLWTALDCPGQMAWRAEGVQTGMLGRMTARVEKPVRAGEPCVVIGWTMSNEGKKYFAGTALFNAANELCAYAKAVWIGNVE